MAKIEEKIRSMSDKTAELMENNNFDLDDDADIENGSESGDDDIDFSSLKLDE